MKSFVLFFFLGTVLPLWGECSLSLSNEDIAPSPMEYKDEGNISITITNLSPRQIPAVTEGEPTCTFNILLSLLDLKNHDIGVITSSSQLETYFDINYIVEDKRIEFIQKLDIPADWNSQLGILLDVVGQSTSSNALNGFLANILNTSNEASTYTYTNPAVLIGNNDLNNSVQSRLDHVAFYNITSNDTINGKAVTLGVDITITSINNTTPLQINQNTGSVTVLGNTVAGTYNVDYTICEVFNSLNCVTSSITVTVDESIPPNYEISLTVSKGIFINTPGNFDTLIRVTEVSNGENTGDVVLSINKNNKMSMSFDTTLTDMGGRILSNSNWEWIETASTYRVKYIGTSTIFPDFTRMYIGVSGTFTPPDSAKGKFPLKVKLRNGSGDTNPTNNEDAEVISYSSDN